MNIKISWFKKHPLFSYFFLAYLFSWVIEIPLALQSQGVIRQVFPMWFHYLAGYGPLLSAWIVSSLTRGADGVRDLWHRIIKWKVKPVYWLFAFSPLLVFTLIGLARWILQGQALDLLDLGQINFLPPLGLAVIPLWIFTFGFGEETGWRGFALPRLQKKFNAFIATLILWAFWALWHLPLFFYSYETNIIPGMLIGLLAGAISFTWLYNSTGGSILLVAIWHGLFDTTTACQTCGTSTSGLIINILVMVWTVLLVILFKPKNLSKSERQKI